MAQSSSTAHTGTNKEVSDNPLDYLSMIIYIKDGIHACEQLKTLVAPRMDILVQNVDHIKEQKPPWLTGVPTVVKLPSRQILTGTRAVNAVNELCQNSMQGVDGLQVVHGGTAHASLSPTEDRSPPMFNTLFSCQNEAEERRTSIAQESTLFSSDSRYEDKPREKQNDRSLEDIMRIRGGMA